MKEVLISAVAVSPFITSIIVAGWVAVSGSPHWGWFFALSLALSTMTKVIVGT